jgi:hypothetical protein
MKFLLSFFLYLSALNSSAANGSKGAESPMVIAIVEQAHSDHIIVVTRDEFKRKLVLNDASQINYVGFDDAKKEIKASFCIRAQVKDEVISSIYVTSSIGKELVFPTAKMVKMTSNELFDLADLNQNGRVCYVEISKTIKHSLKHGPVTFSKSDVDNSGALNVQELEAFLGMTKWWRMSRVAPEDQLKAHDKDQNNLLSKEELVSLLGSEAHIDIFFKRADKNASVDLDLDEVTQLIESFVFGKKN